MTAPSSRPPKPGSGSTGQHEVAERDAPGRRDRARVPHLQLGQQHLRLTLSVALRSAPMAHEEPEVLAGGVANAGAVVRVGDARAAPGERAHRRRSTTSSRYLRGTGFTGAPNPVGIDADGRERLEFIDGEVPRPAVPGVGAVRRVAGVGRPAAAPLPRGRRAATARRPARRGATRWSTRTPTAGGGATSSATTTSAWRTSCSATASPSPCSTSTSPRPGRPVYDLAQFARMCVPIDDESRVRLGWRPADLERAPAPRRRLVRARRPRRDELFDAAGRRRSPAAASSCAAGWRPATPNFIAMWESMGGMARFDRRRAWFAAHAARFRDALG